jgi:hypothetical protein
MGFSHNAYGLDYVGFTNRPAVEYYQNRIRNEQPTTRCGVFYTQQMWMDGCGGTSQNYGTAHELSVYIGANDVTMRRDGASASR